jgi:hypothetical protein
MIMALFNKGLIGSCYGGKNLSQNFAQAAGHPHKAVLSAASAIILSLNFMKILLSSFVN